MASSDDVTEDRSSPKNSEVYINILSDQVQSNGAKLIRRRFIVQMTMTQNIQKKVTEEF